MEEQLLRASEPLVEYARVRPVYARAVRGCDDLAAAAWEKFLADLEARKTPEPVRQADLTTFAHFC